MIEATKDLMCHIMLRLTKESKKTIYHKKGEILLLYESSTMALTTLVEPFFSHTSLVRVDLTYVSSLFFPSSSLESGVRVLSRHDNKLVFSSVNYF